MDRLIKNIAFWTVVVLVILFTYKFLQQPSIVPDLRDSARFTEALKAGKIARVSLPPGATIGGELAQPTSDGKPARFFIAAPAYRDLVDDLLRHDVNVQFGPPKDSTIQTAVFSWVPILVLIGIWIYFMRTMQAGRRNSENQPGSSMGP